MYLSPRRGPLRLTCWIPPPLRKIGGFPLEELGKAVVDLAAAELPGAKMIDGQRTTVSNEHVHSARGGLAVGMYETFQVASPKQRWHAAGLVVKCALNRAGAKYGPSGTILEALGEVHRVQLMHGVAAIKGVDDPRIEIAYNLGGWLVAT